ncbi:MAG: hypothetical protein ACK5TN_10225 [Acidobacteriota bacterium]
MTRFAPSKHFVYMAVIAVLLGLMCAYVGWHWAPAFVPATLFFATALALLWLSFHPIIELTDCELLLGNRAVSWSSITDIRTTGWLTPLVLKLHLESGPSITLIFAGDLESSGRLKDMICQCAPHALLNGLPQRQRQAVLAVRNGATAEFERHPILTPQDEAEVERMFQRLREVGHLDAPGKDL